MQGEAHNLSSTPFPGDEESGVAAPYIAKHVATWEEKRRRKIKAAHADRRAMHSVREGEERTDGSAPFTPSHQQNLDRVNDFCLNASVFMTFAF